MRTTSELRELEQRLGGRGLQALFDLPPEVVDLLPVAAYACDASGRILWFNASAADLWGRAPRIGDDTELFCGSYRLFFDGREISREETPMAAAVRSGEAIHGAEGVVERPDGTRVWAAVHIEPVKDATGTVIGAINCFLDITERKRSDALLAGQKRILEMVASGAPLDDTLAELTRFIEAQEDGVLWRSDDRGR